MTYHTPLTPRQQRILVLRLTGHTGDDIGAELGIARHTVYLHVLTIKERLGTHSHAELFQWAWDAGLIQEHMSTAERGEAEGSVAA